MDHEGRISICKEYAARLKEKIGSDLVFFGVGGSTYTKEDREDSDIDAIVVTESENYGGAPKWIHEWHNGIQLSIEYFNKTEAERILKNPGWGWPQNMFTLTNQMPIYQKYNFLEWCTGIINTIDYQLFIDSAYKQITIAKSAIGKVRKAHTMGDLGFIRSAALLTLTYIDMAVALINKDALYPGFSIREVLLLMSKYRILPDKYVETARKIWDSCDGEEINNSIEYLLDSTYALINVIKTNNKD
jgi:hypothetical protein